MARKASQDILVIGGGVVGLCTAYYLAQSGAYVRVLDAGDGTKGTSFGNAGYVVPSHIIPLATRARLYEGLSSLVRKRKGAFSMALPLRLSSLQWLWHFYQATHPKRTKKAIPVLDFMLGQSQQLMRSLIKQEQWKVAYRQTGLLNVFATARTLASEIQHLKDLSGYELKYQVLDSKEVQAHHPELKIQSCGGIYYPNDDALSPAHLMQSLRAWLEAHSRVSLCYGVRIRRFQVQNKRLLGLECANGTQYSANAYVLAAGAWANELLKPTGLRIPICAGQGYSMFIPHPSALRFQTPTLFVDGHLAVNPMPEGIRLASAMRLTIPDTKGLDSNNSQAMQHIQRTLSRYVPDCTSDTFAHHTPWTGYRPCSPDGLPYIGPVPHAQQLWIATGHAMLGLSLAPWTGHTIAQWITKNQNPIPPQYYEMLKPNRYSP